MVGNGSFAWFNGDGLNFLYGGDGADTLTGGEGRDVLDLGAADGDEDVIVVNDPAASRSDLRMDIVRNFNPASTISTFMRWTPIRACPATSASPGERPPPPRTGSGIRSMVRMSCFRWTSPAMPWPTAAGASKASPS
ncbi:MAG: hypothetical protein HZT43_11080 [Exiguobacterium profundum]|nr:MAG: hypothetical protein HZT43_11080 [Exiguobacterium profundum]